MCTHETISVVSPWRSTSWKCGFISLSKPPTPFSPRPAFCCLQYHLLYWERGYNKCRTCALSSHMTIFTIPNLLTVSKWWQYYRIFAESLQHYLKMCLECDHQYDMHGNQIESQRQQNTGIREVHSNVWGMWLQVASPCRTVTSVEASWLSLHDRVPSYCVWTKHCNQSYNTKQFWLPGTTTMCKRSPCALITCGKLTY